MTDAYTFSPGYLVAANGSAPLHAEWSAMSEAHLYCDAEPRTPRPRLQPQANGPPYPHTPPHPSDHACYSHVRASAWAVCSGFSLAVPGFSSASTSSDRSSASSAVMGATTTGDVPTRSQRAWVSYSRACPYPINPLSRTRTLPLSTP